MRDEWTEAGRPYGQCSMRDVRAAGVPVKVFLDAWNSMVDFGDIFREYFALNPDLLPEDNDYDPEDIDWLIDDYYRLKPVVCARH